MNYHEEYNYENLSKFLQSTFPNFKNKSNEYIKQLFVETFISHRI
ncbi:hypothetical protein [Spiroplasma monobiae]|nr:hypothetical protein [Spiroplasma monobiae]